jgi:hypothetical protein
MGCGFSSEKAQDQSNSSCTETAPAAWASVVPAEQDETLLLNEPLDDPISVNDRTAKTESLVPTSDRLLNSSRADDSEPKGKAPELRLLPRPKETQVRTDQWLAEQVCERQLLHAVAVDTSSPPPEVSWGMDEGDGDGELDRHRPSSCGCFVQEPLDPLWWEEAMRRRFGGRGDSFPNRAI